MCVCVRLEFGNLEVAGGLVLFCSLSLGASGVEGLGGFGFRMREFTVPLQGPGLLAGSIGFMILLVRSFCVWSLGGSGSRFVFWRVWTLKVLAGLGFLCSELFPHPRSGVVRF